MHESSAGNLAMYSSPTTCGWTARQWFALQTRSRHEKMVAQELDVKKIQCYLPLYWSVRQWSDRYKSVLLPLFPGYLFVRVRCEEQLLILETRGVVKILGASSGPTPIPEKEILDLESVVESQIPIQPGAGLLKGQRVRVIRGPLAGVEGVLQDYKKSYRLAVSIKLLGRSVIVEISCQDVVAI